MDNSKKIILDLCGGTGCWSKPYKEAGYDVRLITLPEYDVLTYKPPKKVYGVLAAPPCTDFCNAGSQYWKQKDISGQTQKSLDVVYACLDIISKTNPEFWALENPKGRLKQFIGSPIYSFYHYEFDGLFTKQTFLWGDFNTMIVKGPVNPHPIRLDEAKFSDFYGLPDDYKIAGTGMNKLSALRSVYPPMFCRAFYEANL